MTANEIVIFESSDCQVSLGVDFQDDTAWLTQAQMVELFSKTQPVISRHINNAFDEGEVDRESNMQYLHIGRSDKPVAFYSLY